MLKSNSKITQSYADQLTAAAQTLNGVNEESLDTASILAGNQKNHDVVKQAITLGTSYCTALDTTCQHLSFIAGKMEVIDQANATRIGGVK